MKQHFEPASIWVITSCFPAGHPMLKNQPDLNERVLERLCLSNEGGILYHMAVIEPSPVAASMADRLMGYEGRPIIGNSLLAFKKSDSRAREWMAAPIHPRKYVTPIGEWQRMVPGPFQALQRIAQDVLYWIQVEYQAQNPYARQVLAIVHTDIATALCGLLGGEKEMPFGPAEGFALTWHEGRYVVGYTFSTYP